jgi:hypothetical protein
MKSPPLVRRLPTPKSRPCSSGFPNGTVRVLIGSIAKMGTGTNVQKWLIALHHVDGPDRDTIAANARDGLTIDGRTYIASDAAVALSARLEQLPSWVDAATRIPLGNLRGLSFGMVLRPGFPPDAFLQGKSTLSTIFAKQRPGPRAVMNGLHALAGNCAIEANSVGQRIDIAEGQLRDYAARIRIRKRQQTVPLPPGETADDSDPASDTLPQPSAEGRQSPPSFARRIIASATSGVSQPSLFRK